MHTVEDGIYQVDPEGRIVAANDVIIEVTGCDREDLLGELASGFVPDPNDFEQIDHDIQGRLADDDHDGGPIEEAVLTADGGTVAGFS